MRTLDGRILVDLGDNTKSQLTGSVEYATVSDINENETSYSLLPERINYTPYISSSIYNTSSPQIKPIQFNDPDKYNMFVDSQGIVKVAVGTNFILRVKAKQPPVYNVENGVPTIYEDQTKLKYEWQKNGETIVTDEDQDRPNSVIRIDGAYNEELHFTNVSPKFAGIYYCVISNDIGSTESEQINIEVYNPDIEDLFYANLVENPYGKNGTDGWNSPDTEFTVGRLSDTDFKNFSQPWNTDLFGYSKDMLYPKPYQINTFHLRNSNFTQDLIQEGHYFTRDRFKYFVKDGKSVITANYDVDLSPITEYIQSSIYGVTGVRAIFGCYIGNAISKFRVSVLNALITKRSSKFALIPSKLRLDIINALLAGVPILSEVIKVNVQELDNETPLMSLINGNMVPGYTILDPWSNAIDSTTNANVAANIQGAINVDNQSNSAKIIDIIQNNRLFPGQQYVPTYGQYARFNKFVIDKLNFRTNKIRINVTFEAYHDMLNLVDKYHISTSDECFEYVPWEWIQLPMHWPSKADEDFLKNADVTTTPQPNISVDAYNIKVLNADTTDPYQYASVLGSPRAMVTGFNLVLIPLESTSVTKTNYYTSTILETLNEVNPRLQQGTSVSSQTGVYLGSLSDYTYEIIGVNIENRYNIPTNSQNNSEYKRAQGEVGTRTTVTTYLYNKSHSVDFPQVLNFTSSIWQPFNISNDRNFRITVPILQGVQYYNPEFVVVYNSGSSDLMDASLSQVAGNIESNIIKYTNNLVTDVPISFLTQSIRKRDYIKNIGFTLNLSGEDYGVPTTGSNVGLTSPEIKQRYYNDWSTLSASFEYDYRYNLLQKIDQPSTSSVNFVRYINTSQHIIYSDKFAANWVPTGVLAAQTAYSGQDSKISLADVFQFTTNSFYDRSQQFASTRTVNQPFDRNGTIRAARSATEAMFQVARNMYYDIDVNGQTYTMQYAYSSSILEEPVIVPSGAGTISTTNITYVLYTAGVPKDHIKLAGAKSDGVTTPAAIVVPSQRKIYYFLYNYVDNVLSEQ